MKKRKRQVISMHVSRYSTVKDIHKSILARLQKDLPFALLGQLSRLWLLDTVKLPKAQGGNIEALMDAMQIELGFQSNLEAGQIEIEDLSGRVLKDDESLQDVENKVLLLELKAIKGSVNSPEADVREHWVLLSSAEAEAKLRCLRGDDAQAGKTQS